MRLTFGQINVVVPDVAGATRFLRALGADVPPVADEWAEWEPHHVELPAAAGGFEAGFDSPAFACHWGGLPEHFAGVVLNLRTEDRAAVDAAFERAVSMGAECLRAPYDAFWGARYAVVQGPGPIVVGLMSALDPEFQGQPPAISDFA